MGFAKLSFFFYNLRTHLYALIIKTIGVGAGLDFSSSLLAICAFANFLLFS